SMGAQESNHSPLVNMKAYPIHSPAAPKGLPISSVARVCIFHFVTRVWMTICDLFLLCTTTLSPCPNKVNESPVILPCSASKMLGGPPVRVNLSSADV